MRRWMRFSAAAAVVLLAAACGSSGSESSTSSVPPEPTYVAASLNCDQYAVRVTNLYSAVSKSSLNIGTTNPIDSYVTEMQQILADLKLNAPACAPDAEEELAAMDAAVVAYSEAYEPSTDEAVATANEAAFVALARQGSAMASAMGLDTSQWDQLAS